MNLTRWVLKLYDTGVMESIQPMALIFKQKVFFFFFSEIMCQEFQLVFHGTPKWLNEKYTPDFFFHGT